MTPTWFLYIGGISLFVLGLLQIQARPRQPTDSLYQRFVNLGTLWSLICIAVGALIVLYAMGYLTPPAKTPEPTRPARLRPGR